MLQDEINILGGLMKNIVLLLALILIALSGMSSEEIKNIDFKKADELIFDINDEIEVEPNFISYFQDHSKAYLAYAYNSNNLVFFDLKNLNIESQTKIKYGFETLKIRNFDSIYYFPSESNSFRQIDTSGKIINELDISKVYSASRQYLCYYFDMDLENPGFHLFMDLSYDYAPSDFYKQPKLLSVKINDNFKAVKFDTSIEYPQKFKEGNEFLSFYPRFVVVNGYIYYSFEKDHNIYKYDYDGKLVIQKEIKSKYIDKFIPIDTKESNVAFSSLYQIEEPTYLDMYYDRYRDLFYRVCLHRIKVRNEDGTVNDYNDKAWSIQMFDNNLRFVKEIKMDNNLTRFFDVIPEGIVVLNKSTDDSQLVFTKFEVTINE